MKEETRNSLKEGMRDSLGLVIFTVTAWILISLSLVGGMVISFLSR